MCSLRYTVHPEHNRRETRLPQGGALVGGIGAAGRDFFGLGKFRWLGGLLIQVIQLGIFWHIFVEVDINHTNVSC